MHRHLRVRTKTQLTSAARYLLTFAKWLGVAILTGVVGGAVGTLFHMAVGGATELREKHPLIILLLPLAGLLIAWLYRAANYDDGGTDIIISSVRTKNHIPLRIAPLIFISTALTHLCGGSAGREGAALQLGGSIGGGIGEALRLKSEDKGLAVMCGMSALFSALFGTPIAACFFAMEVISVGIVYYAGLVPCLFSALVAYKLSLILGVEPLRFEVAVPAVDMLSVLKIVLLAAMCAAVSILFISVIKGMRSLMSGWFKNSFLRVLVGSAAVIAATFLVGSGDYNGAGMAVIERAVCDGEAFAAAFLLKIAFTAVTLAAGFKGGEIVPTLFIGATFGCAAAPLVGLSPQFGAAIGIAALFCSVVNCPTASIFFSLEIFGSGGVIFFAAACAVSYMLSGSYGLYSSQRLVYSKLHARYINRHAK